MVTLGFCVYFILMDKKHNRRVVHLFLLGFVLSLTACQTPPVSTPFPLAPLIRKAETPLVVALPGFTGMLFGHTQEEYFGHLEPILESEGFPSVVLIYNTQAHPLTSGADLSTDRRSITVTRILPALVHAVRDENEIRQHQGLPPLSEINLIGFSQGSILAVDLLVRLRELRQQLDFFFQMSTEEYPALVEDSEFRAFNNTAEDYVAIRNIKVQREKDFEVDPDLKLIYKHSEKRAIADFKRLYDYLTGPDTYYPKFAEKLRQEYQDKDISKIENLDQWLDYAQFRTVLPVRFRFFSIAGTLFGIQEANSGYFFIKHFPAVAHFFIAVSATEQIRDTRVGSLHQLELVELLDQIRQLGTSKEVYQSTYFIVGVKGDKGDGLLRQSSAHLSEHLLSTLDLGALQKGSENSFKTETLPKFQVTGIPGEHMPNQGFFVKRLGISQIEPESPVLPFLLAFLRKDTKALEALHFTNGVALQQFMVEIQAPDSTELNEYQFEVKGHSGDIKVSKPFNNPSTRVFVVTGAFKSKNKAESMINFSVSKNNEKTLEFNIPVRPGKIHFIKILDAATDPTPKAQVD